ncbi:MAG: hypothetical protein NZ954_06250 [Thermofilaceae archaeon]|nr:hypothetical protein [Thermofilaceae archaeon]MDW8003801.1 hypothetical protein [Thermofilaceae archaeon]
MKTFYYVVSTTRRSNPRVRSLARELALSLPKALKVNRGKMSLPALIAYARSLGAKRVLCVGRGLSGNPGSLMFIDSAISNYHPQAFVIKLCGVKLARELGVTPHPPGMILVAASSDALCFGQELAVALDLPLIETLNVRSLEHVCDSVLVVEPLSHLKAKFVLKFLKTSDSSYSGPRLLVEKYKVIKYGTFRGSIVNKGF